MSTWKLTLLLVAIFRFIAPILIFYNPILITVISFSLDTVDSEIAFRAKLSWKAYSLYDKLLDYWWYIWILIFCLNLSIFPIILILFIIRSISQIAFFFTKKEKYFFYFPNILEVFFILYLFSSGSIDVPILLLISTLIVLPREYIVHIKKIALFMPKAYSKWQTTKTRRP